MKIFLTTLFTLAILSSFINAQDNLAAISELDEAVGESPSAGVRTARNPAAIRYTSSFRSDDNDVALIVPAGDISAGEIKNIREDLQIMARIFDKKIAETEYAPFGNRSAMIWREFDSDNAAQGIYLQDYGVVFTASVNFPLSPTAGPKEVQSEKADTLWEQTRKEALTPNRRKHNNLPFEGFSHRRAVKYDAELVGQFQTRIIHLLKHAANIRNLKPNDKIAVIITGKKEQPAIDSMSYGMMGMMGGMDPIMMGGMGSPGDGAYGGMGGGMMGGGMGGAYGGGGMGGGYGRPGGSDETEPNVEEIQSAASVITIAALKSNVDKFAQNELDYDRFLKTVKVFTY